MLSSNLWLDITIAITILIYIMSCWQIVVIRLLYGDLRYRLDIVKKVLNIHKQLSRDWYFFVLRAVLTPTDATQHKHQ